MNQPDPFCFEINRPNPVDIEVTASFELNCNFDDFSHFWLEEIDREGHIIDPQVPFQINAPISDGQSYSLVFLVRPRDLLKTRHYRLSQNSRIASPQQDKLFVNVEEVYYQGQETYKIKTPAATYYFHQQGGGLASMIDPEGNDWISYRQSGGSDGRFRGIPNIKHPENYFHPGSTDSQSALLSSGPLCCQIHTQTIDGMCEAVWEFYPLYARFNLLKAPIPYWFLYEGTPGGALKESECFIFRSNGTCTSAHEPWEDILDPGWVIFGSPDSTKVLFLLQENTEHKISSYWPMEHNMTVFGFGRKGATHYLENIPAQYSLGFLDKDNFDTLAGRLHSIMPENIALRTGKPDGSGYLK